MFSAVVTLLLLIAINIIAYAVYPWVVIITLFISLVVLASGIRIVRPKERGVVERLGKYHGIRGQGINWIIPFIDSMIKIDLSEQMVDAEPQEIITEDNLNATVDAQIYFKVKTTEKDLKATLYNVYNYKVQIINLARTTLRNVIGNNTFKDVNSKRDKLNDELQKTLQKETDGWGIDIVRTELKEIEPPKDVQETMNKVLKAENEKRAAIDFATAEETKADGSKRATIKVAQGASEAIELQAKANAKAIKLKAGAEAEAIKLVNESAEKYFKGNAQTLKKLEVTQKALKKGTKYIIPDTKDLTMVVSEASGVTPIKK